MFQLRSFTETRDSFKDTGLGGLCLPTPRGDSDKTIAETEKEKLSYTTKSPSVPKLPRQVVFWLPPGMPNGAAGGILVREEQFARDLLYNTRRSVSDFQLLKSLPNYVRCCSGCRSGGKAARGLRAGKACGKGVPAGWEAAGGNGVRRLGARKSSLLIGRFPQKKSPSRSRSDPWFPETGAISGRGEQVQEKGPKSERRDFVGLVCRGLVFCFFFTPDAPEGNSLCSRRVRENAAPRLPPSPLSLSPRCPSATPPQARRTPPQGLPAPLTTLALRLYSPLRRGPYRLPRAAPGPCRHGTGGLPRRRPPHAKAELLPPCLPPQPLRSPSPPLTDPPLPRLLTRPPLPQWAGPGSAPPAAALRRAGAEGGGKLVAEEGPGGPCRRWSGSRTSPWATASSGSKSASTSRATGPTSGWCGARSGTW